MPPGSSLEFTIRFPEERRERLFFKASLAFDKFRAAVVAALLLFTVIAIGD
jgi:hypothetical protein